MANFRSTADYLDSILSLSGETTNGNSAFEARALHYLNRIHNSLIVGGNEFNIEVDEVWPWSVSRDPIIIELEPKATGTVTSMANGSNEVTLSAAPSVGSLKGWHIRFGNESALYKVAANPSISTSVTLEGNYVGTLTGSSYEAYKLDYELIPTHISLDTSNNALTFTETNAGTNLSIASLVNNYTIADLRLALEGALDNVGASSFYTVSYDADTRLFSISSSGSGGDGIFSLLGATATNAAQIKKSILPTLGFALKDYTGALSYTAERALGAICKLIAPFKLQSDNQGPHEVYGLDPIVFQEKHPLERTREGNPAAFTVVEERDDGYIKVRFNNYVQEKKRIYVNYVPLPLDLYDNQNSHPLVPRKYSQVLEYGAASYLLGEKNDNRAPQYFQIAGQVLESMVRNNRRQSKRVDPNFGGIVARDDLRNDVRRIRRYGYTRGDW